MYSRASRYSSPLQVFPGQERLLSPLLPDRSPRERSLPTSRCFQPLRANPSAAASSRGGTARTPPPLPGNPRDLPPRRAAPHRTRAARCTPPAPPGLGPHLQRSGRSHRPPCPAQFSPKIKAPGPALTHPTCLFPFLHFFPGFFPLPIFSLLFTSPFSSHPFSYPPPLFFLFSSPLFSYFYPSPPPFPFTPFLFYSFFSFCSPPAPHRRRIPRGNPEPSRRAPSVRGGARPWRAAAPRTATAAAAGLAALFLTSATAHHRGGTGPRLRRGGRRDNAPPSPTATGSGEGRLREEDGSGFRLWGLGLGVDGAAGGLRALGSAPVPQPPQSLLVIRRIYEK